MAAVPLVTIKDDKNEDLIIGEQYFIKKVPMAQESDQLFLMYNSGPDPNEGVYRVQRIGRSPDGDIEAWCISMAGKPRLFTANGHQFTRIIKNGGRRKSRRLRKRFRKTRK